MTGFDHLYNKLMSRYGKKKILFQRSHQDNHVNHENPGQNSEQNTTPRRSLIIEY